MDDAAQYGPIETTRTAEIVLCPETAKFLDEKAAESFKRQTDLEESIWRALPLFSGGLIAAGAIISSIANSLPPLARSIFSVLAYASVTGALALFGLSIWWLWQVIKPREFEYLPDDTLVANFADHLTQFQSAQGLSGDALDQAVTAELRAYMRGAYVNSAKSTFGHNQARLSARSQVIVCLLWGFVLAFGADGLVTGHRLLYGSQETEAAPNGNKDTISKPATLPAGAGSAAPDSSAHADHSGRRLVDQVQHCRTGSGQGLNGGRKEFTHRANRIRAGTASAAGRSPHAAADKNCV